MAAYKIGETREGARIWWESWQYPHGVVGTTFVRDATDEEAALMEKVVWDRDTPADLDQLKRLIRSPTDAHAVME